jgi:hypothetical protein
VAQKVRFGPSSSTGNVWFDLLAVRLDANDGSERRLELWPHLLIYGDDAESRAYMFFVGAKAHQGVIQIGANSRRSSPQRSIEGWFDQRNRPSSLPADGRRVDVRPGGMPVIDAMPPAPRTSRRHARRR